MVSHGNRAGAGLLPRLQITNMYLWFYEIKAGNILGLALKYHNNRNGDTFRPQQTVPGQI